MTQTPDQATPAPAVSVVVTCYNQADFIPRAVKSVLDQTARSHIAEILVVDDGSTDNSARILSGLAAAHPLVTCVSKPNGGAASARNAGIERASGDYIAFLDGDDEWKPQKLQVQLEAARNHPDAGLLFTDFEEFNDRDGVLRQIWVREFSASDPDPLLKLFLSGGPILPSAALIRRDAFERCGTFDESLWVNEDPEMWLRIAHRYPLQRTPGLLVRKRELSGSLSTFADANLDALREISRRVYEMRPDLLRFKSVREARILIETGVYRMSQKNWNEARAVFFEALRTHPFAARAWGYFLLLCLPGSPEAWLGAAKKSLGAIRRKAGRRALSG